MVRIESDIKELKKYGSVAGLDLSPSVEMLRPRQRLSILVNAIHACYLGAKGIKILPNYRAGDFGTICAVDFFPDDCSFIIGNLGCDRNGYKEYGEYQLEILLRKKSPEILYVYGALLKNTATRLIKKYGFEVVSFPDRRNRVRNNSRSWHYWLLNGNVCKEPYADAAKGGVA